MSLVIRSVLNSMVTTRYTKSMHQQATKHNIARGGFTNFIKRGPVSERKPTMAVEPLGPSGVLGWSVWSERAFSLLSPDKQRAAVSCMGVIVVKKILVLCMGVTAYG